jgi:hypothetical protein
MALKSCQVHRRRSDAPRIRRRTNRSSRSCATTSTSPCSRVARTWRKPTSVYSNCSLRCWISGTWSRSADCWRLPRSMNPRRNAAVQRQCPFPRRIEWPGRKRGQGDHHRLAQIRSPSRPQRLPGRGRVGLEDGPANSRSPSRRRVARRRRFAAPEVGERAAGSILPHQRRRWRWSLARMGLCSPM